MCILTLLSISLVSMGCMSSHFRVPLTTSIFAITCTASTRSSGCKLLYKASCSSITRHFYLNRMPALPSTSLSLLTIKRHLTIYTWNYLSILTQQTITNLSMSFMWPTNTNRSHMYPSSLGVASLSK